LWTSAQEVWTATRTASSAGHVPFARHLTQPSRCRQDPQHETRKDEARSFRCSAACLPGLLFRELQKELTVARPPRTFSGKRGSYPEANMRRALLFMIAATLVSAAEEPAKEGKALFNGTDLSGWKLRDPGAKNRSKWTVCGGVKLKADMPGRFME